MKKLIYLGGYSVKNNFIGILAAPDIPEDVESTFFSTMSNGNWSHRKLHFDIVSLTYIESNKDYLGCWYLIGKRGEVIELTDTNEVTIRKIPTAGTGKRKYGYLSNICNINGDLYICGYNRQVYKKINKDWILISDNIINKEEIISNGFEAITGFDEKNIYTVGDEGEIWFFNGNSWFLSDSPTNQNLSNICCVSENEYWICGDNGVIIKGQHEKWEIIYDDDDITENWWDICYFQNTIYLAGDDCLAKIENNSPKEINVTSENKITTFALSHSKNTLWSIGEEHIFSFNGKHWGEIIYTNI